PQRSGLRYSVRVRAAADPVIARARPRSEAARRSRTGVWATVNPRLTGHHRSAARGAGRAGRRTRMWASAGIAGCPSPPALAKFGVVNSDPPDSGAPDTLARPMTFSWS